MLIRLSWSIETAYVIFLSSYGATDTRETQKQRSKAPANSNWLFCYQDAIKSVINETHSVNLKADRQTISSIAKLKWPGDGLTLCCIHKHRLSTLAFICIYLWSVHTSSCIALINLHWGMKNSLHMMPAYLGSSNNAHGIKWDLDIATNWILNGLHEARAAYAPQGAEHCRTWCGNA